MDGNRYDRLSRSRADPQSRRSVLRGLAGVLAAGALGARAAEAQDICPIPGQTRNRKGQCVCPPGTDACFDGCYDLRRDSENCGACDHDCLGGECRKGECRCAEGTELCNGSCFSPWDYESAPNNCGSCGNVCLNGSCTNGSCCDGDCTGKACGEDDGCGNACFGSCDEECEICDVFSRTCVPDFGASCSTGRCCGGLCAACVPSQNICLNGSNTCNNDCRLCCSGNSLWDPRGFFFCT